MTEVQFAKQFLTTLDSKNTKYQPDHVFDPKTFQVRTPYTLPKLSHPPHPLPPKATFSATPVPGSLPAASETESKTINLTLKSSRNPTFTLHLVSIPVSTQIPTLKTHIQTVLLSTPSDKIKILYNKKPISPSKPSINDVLETDPTQSEVEFGVMIIGGASDPTPTTQTIDLSETSAEKSTTTEEEVKHDVPQDTSSTILTQKSHEPVQPGEASGKAVLETAEFWDDLQGFLEQRLKDTDEAQRVRAVFEAA